MFLKKFVVLHWWGALALRRSVSLQRRANARSVSIKQFFYRGQFTLSFQLIKLTKIILQYSHSEMLTISVSEDRSLNTHRQV